MSNIQQNIDAAKLAREQVTAHCMAFRVEESATHLLVIFPSGYYPDGVRVTKERGVVWACEQALFRMERAWRRS